MLLVIAKAIKSGQKYNACYRSLADFSHGLRSNGLRSHWRLLQAPNAIKPICLWSPKSQPFSDIGKYCWMVIIPETSCCADGNVNWTALLERYVSVPGEVKDVYNVKFLMSQANKISGAEQIIIIIIIYNK